MATTTTSAKWARWNWSKGMGRGHRLFTDGDLTKTACQTPRKNAKHAAVKTYASKPTDGPICPTCELFDALHQKFVQTTDTLTLVGVAAGPTAEPQLPAEVPCGCGCVKSEAFVAWKQAHDAWLDSERERKSAAFEAFIASKATVAA